MNFKDTYKRVRIFIGKVRRGYAGKPNPYRDWNVLLVISTLIFLGSIAMNAVFFVRVFEGIPLSQEVETNPPYREVEALSEQLGTVEGLFEVRAETFNDVLNTPYSFVDPARN